jgi:hypothetical protein
VSSVQASRTILSDMLTIDTPYLPGDEVLVADPDGGTYLARVEQIVPVPGGTFTLFAEAVSPPSGTTRMICTRVDADGLSDIVQRRG